MLWLRNGHHIIQGPTSLPWEGKGYLFHCQWTSIFWIMLDVTTQNSEFNIFRPPLSSFIWWKHCIKVAFVIHNMTIHLCFALLIVAQLDDASHHGAALFAAHLFIVRLFSLCSTHCPPRASPPTTLSMNMWHETLVHLPWLPSLFCPDSIFDCSIAFVAFGGNRLNSGHTGDPDELSLLIAMTPSAGTDHVPIP